MTAPKFARSTRRGRVYDVAAHELPSVTTVIKQLHAPALERWKMNKVAEAAYDTTEWRAMPREAGTKMIMAAGTAFGERAADVGSYVHSLIEAGADPELAPDELVPRLVAAAGIVGAMGAHYATELTLVNRDLGYAGTADVLSWRTDAGYQDQLSCTDWKTVQAGKDVGWVNQALQLAALAGCTEYMDSDGIVLPLESPITEVAVIGLRPDGSVDEKRTDDENTLARLLMTFEGLLRSWELERDWSLTSW